MFSKKYKIGNCEVLLPRSHRLPVFQKKYKLYDRFLPVLARHINGDQIIFDVGANVGDSAIAMRANCDNLIMCFETNEKYFRYLEKNISGLKEVFSYNYHIGTDGITLDSINTLNVIFIKVDTDGYDYDVLRSAKKILTTSKPILFWENYIEHGAHLNEYSDMYDYLQWQGYNNIFVFDNFGNMMLENSNYNTIRDLNTYLHSMNNGCTRTIYYTDILATTDKYYDCVKAAIEDYKENWINK